MVRPANATEQTPTGIVAVSAMRRHVLLRAAWIASTCALVGCGGSGSPAKSPDGTGLASGTDASQVAGVPPGQQVGISDAPSSGGSGAARPKMNAAAAALYVAGMQAFQNGDLDGASSQFTKATEADSKAYQAYYSLGVVRERLGNSSGALSGYSKAIAIVSDYEPAIVAYAVLTAQQGNPDAAEEYLNGRLAKMERSAALITALAEVKSIRGDSGAAQRLAKEALKSNPDYRPAMVVMARDHYRSRRLDLSLYALQGILDGYGTENPPRDKDNPEALLIRGLIYKERGQRAAAMADFRRCIDIRPDLVEAKVQLATYLLEAGNAPEAVPLLESALRYDRDNSLARMNLGDGYRLLGRVADAKTQLDWVAKKDPQLAQVHYALGLLYLFGENVPGVTPKEAAERAIASFEEYKKRKPRSGPGQADDVDELITAAKSKKAVIEASEAEKAAASEPATQPKGATSGTRSERTDETGDSGSGEEDTGQ
ncbi:MAG: tetratricopeptide repeat protein [Myxococcales bacterium]